MTTTLSVKQLCKRYPIQRGVFKRTVGYHEVIKSMSFDIKQGEILAIVGESGCGKSTLARLMMGLEAPSSGEIHYNNQRIDQLPHHRQIALRRDIQMVFQDPSAALNARFSIGKILQEPLEIHSRHIKGMQDKTNRLHAAERILEQVELPKDFLNRYPHELSGGQRQRIAIARSIILNPTLLLLDEPLSALDVSLQGQMLRLFEKLQAELGLTIAMISHDLGLVKDFSDRTLVMHFGEIAELGETATVFDNPQHEYTQSLIAAIPGQQRKQR